MSDCCDPASYRKAFDQKQAERKLRDYRRSGLDPVAARFVRFLVDEGVRDKTILEVGGGIGDLHVELLNAGAKRCVNVELSDAYESTAASLLAAEGLTGRVERRLGDFVAQAEQVEPADIVVLNRVICCYPWVERMMGAAAARAQSRLAVAMPRDGLIGHVFIGVDRAIERFRGTGFRAYLHPVAAVEAQAAEAGMRPIYRDRRFVWQGTVFGRG